ncbi:hypothetical protein T492DRAFT_857634 [Pavlovales sp. CCMP2436]|nr:hypothetical protein T492DRAFT_857634 [Pavlovales sp. CCMP2436]
MNTDLVRALHALLDHRALHLRPALEHLKLCALGSLHRRTATAAAVRTAPLGHEGAWCLPEVLSERVMSPLKRAGAAVAPSFAWDGANEGAKTAPARFKGDMARSESTSGKHQAPS